MKIPAFKPSKHFLGDTDLPCLVAKIRNSKLPGVAFRHIAEFKDDPKCEIYVRGKDPKMISKWQRKILQRLFEQKGLAAAIEEAMEEYERTSDGYADMTKEERREVKRIGIAPFMKISLIVIDESKQEVILSARTELDGNLIEHGISLYLRKGRWRFGDGDYLINYRSHFGANYADRKEQLEIERGQKKWGALFPAPNPKTPIQTDCSFLYGRWELDECGTNKLLKQLGHKSITGIGQFHVISEDRLESFLSFSKGRILRFKRRANWVAITEKIHFPEFMKGNRTIEFWCDGNILVEKGGLVYRRAADLKSRRAK